MIILIISIFNITISTIEGEYFLYKNKNENENENENKSVDRKKAYCDWFLIFYAGDKNLLKNFTEEIREIETRNNLSHYTEFENENTENRENRFKGKVVRMVFAESESMKKMNFKFQKKYFERAEEIEKNPIFPFSIKKNERTTSNNSEFFEL